jgi:hypothetical protein
MPSAGAFSSLASDRAVRLVIARADSRPDTAVDPKKFKPGQFIWQPIARRTARSSSLCQSRTNS